MTRSSTARGSSLAAAAEIRGVPGHGITWRDRCDDRFAAEVRGCAVKGVRDQLLASAGMVEMDSPTVPERQLVHSADSSARVARFELESRRGVAHGG